MSIVEVFYQQTPLPFEFGVIFAVLGDLSGEQLLLLGDVVDSEIMPIVAASVLEIGKGVLQLSEPVCFVEPCDSRQFSQRQGFSCRKTSRQAFYIAPRSGITEHGNKPPFLDLLSVADAQSVDQSVVTCDEVGRRIQGCNGSRSLDQVGILDEPASDKNADKNSQHNRDAPAHHPRRSLAHDGLNLLAVKIISLRHSYSSSIGL